MATRIDRPAATGPSEDDVRALLRQRSNWGRWGPDDQRGTLNLITDAKRAAAAALVRSGRTASLARPIEPNQSGPAGTAVCEVSTLDRGGGSGACIDYFGLSYHGFATTHIDALCHVWQDGEMWNGRSPDDEIGPSAARWGDIDQWRDGIVTRGVLVDVPTARGASYVTPDAPVHGHEIERILADRGKALEPGDALLVHSGRSEWNRDNPETPWELLGPRMGAHDDPGVRPGLHASCMEFLRDNDVAVLMWDMLDLSPSGYSFPWSVHNAIASFGLAVVDNTDFGAVLPLCRELDRWEFMVVVAPLRVQGGTGSPVNPLAIF
jgi:kynurenine formamidase